MIGWIWASGEYDTGPAVAYTALLFVGGMADNVLKPLMLARGVDAPMPVILIGALGGMATHGILGMFVGATGPGSWLPDIHALGSTQPGADGANGRGRFPLHRMSRCGDLSPARREQSRVPWRRATLRRPRRGWAEIPVA